MLTLSPDATEKSTPCKTSSVRSPLRKFLRNPAARSTAVVVPSLIAQCLHGFKPGRPPGRKKASEGRGDDRKYDDRHHVFRDGVRGQRTELIKLHKRLFTDTQPGN